MSYFPSISQNVTVDTNNTSSTNITSGAFFVGTLTSTLGVNAIQLTFKADQTCSIIVEQAPSNSLVTGKGTVAANNSTTLTGTGTQFTKYFATGDTVVFDSGGTPQTRTVDVVTSDTVLTVTSAFTGGSLSGKEYQHYPIDIRDTYNYIQNTDFGITVQAIGAYVRVRVKNNGSATTQVFRLGTVLCPIVEAVPRSLDQYGHLVTTTHGLKDEFDFIIKSGPMGTLDVDQPYRLVGTSFSGSTIDSTFWTATQNGTGATTSASTTPGVITMTSGTDNNGFSNLTTVRQARFIFAHPHKFRAIVRLTAATVANSTRRWGAYTAAGGPPVVPVDGFWFEQTGAGTLTLNCRNNSGTITSVSSGSFNGDVSQYTVDTNMHAYEIIYFLGSATFFIDNVKIHTFTPTTTMLSSTFTLPASFQTSSQAINSSAVMEVWAGMILRLGREAGSTISRSQAGAATAQIAKTGAGRLHRLVYSNGTGAGTIILYDALTATNQIATFNLQQNTTLDSVEFMLDFYTGLTYTTTGANLNVTFIFE